VILYIGALQSSHPEDFWH